MKYVLNDDGSIKVTDGKPTVVGDDGKEFGIDAIGAQSKINSITTESNDRRKSLSDITTKLESFKDIKDPVAALDAIQKVESMDKDQEKALDKLKTTINTTWEVKQNDWNEEKERLTTKLFNATVGANFATSKVIGKTVLTPDIAQATFGKHFKADGTATDAAGNPIYSKSKPGEYAEFDEAMGIILDGYKDKNAIMKGSGADGGGGHVSDDGNISEEKTSVQNISDGLKLKGI